LAPYQSSDYQDQFAIEFAEPARVGIGQRPGRTRWASCPVLAPDTCVLANYFRIDIGYPDRLSAQIL